MIVTFAKRLSIGRRHGAIPFSGGWTGAAQIGQPGIEYALGSGRVHYLLDCERRTHYQLPDERTHYAVPEETRWS